MPDLANLTVRNTVDIDSRERAWFVGRCSAVERTLLDCLHRPTYHDGAILCHQIIDSEACIWEGRAEDPQIFAMASAIRHDAGRWRVIDIVRGNHSLISGTVSLPPHLL